MTFKKIAKATAALVLLTSFIAGGILTQPLSAKAADNDKTTKELASSVEAMSEQAEAPKTTVPNLPKASYSSDFRWTEPQVLHGVYSSKDLYFKIPNYWEAKYVLVKIEYSLSAMMKDTPASLTFSINGEPISSVKLDYNGGELKTFYVSIPTSYLKNDAQSTSNYLKVSGYARMFDEEHCMDNTSDANWITITKNSGVEIGYDVVGDAQNLSLFPYPYMSSLDTSGKSTAIEIASPKDDSVVASSMLIMRSLSAFTDSGNEIQVGPYADLSSQDFNNRIIVSLTKDLPDPYKKDIEPYTSRLTGSALVLSEKGVDGKNVLLIVADSAETLAEAPSFLADADRTTQVAGSSTLIPKSTAETTAAARKQSSMNVNQYSLQEITGGGLDFLGAFEQDQTLFLPVSSDYTLSSSAKFSLKFRYSKNLDFTRSLFTVYWGNTPIASKKLSAEKADGDELTFTVPSDVVGTSATSMKFSFMLQIPKADCISRHDAMSWAYITKDSMFYLPSDNNVFMQFDNIPAPYQKNGFLNDVMCLTSNSPTTNELTLLGRILSVYGSASDPYSTLKVKKAKEFDPKDANYNVITTGTPKQNSVINSINDKLFFKFNSNGSQFMTNNKLILTDTYAQTVGTLQLLESPYAKNRAFLVITGPTDSSLSSVSQMLSDSKLRWNLKKDCILVDTNGKAKNYQFKSIKTDDNKPSFGQTLVSNRTSLLFAFAGTAVMLILFAAAVLILIRSKQNKNNGNKKK